MPSLAEAGANAEGDRVQTIEKGHGDKRQVSASHRKTPRAGFRPPFLRGRASATKSRIMKQTGNASVALRAPLSLLTTKVIEAEANRRAHSRPLLPKGLVAALTIYVCYRLPIELLLMGSVGSFPPSAGVLGMPSLDGPQLLQAWLRWDSGWYVRIIRDGYEYVPCLIPNQGCQQASIAFLPLFPLAARGVMWLGLSMTTATFVVTHLSLILALWGIWALVLRRFSEDAAKRAMIAMLAFPTSIFLSAAYAEPMFMAFAIWAALFFERNRSFRAAACVTLAALTRSHGMLLAGSLVVGALLKRRWRMAFTCAALSGLGIGIYLYWQYAKFGDALAFVHARRAWGFIGQPPMEHFRAYWASAKSGERGLEGWLDFLCLPWLAAIGVAAWRRLGALYGIFVLSILAVTLGQGQVWALGRITLCAFPAYIILGTWPRNRLLARALLIVGIAWVVMGGLRFVNGYHTGA